IIMGESLVDFLIGQFAVLEVEWIDRRHKKMQRCLDVLRKIRAAQDRRIVKINPMPQIFPRLGLRSRKIDMTAPKPWAALFMMLDQRQRLRVMNDDEIVPDEIAHTVLMNHLFEDFFFYARKVDLAALQR